MFVGFLVKCLLLFFGCDEEGIVNGEDLNVLWEGGGICLFLWIINGVVLNGLEIFGDRGGLKLEICGNLLFFGLLLFDIWFIIFKCCLILEVWYFWRKGLLFFCIIWVMFCCGLIILLFLNREDEFFWFIVLKVVFCW